MTDREFLIKLHELLDFPGDMPYLKAKLQVDEARRLIREWKKQQDLVGSMGPIRSLGWSHSE